MPSFNSIAPDKLVRAALPAIIDVRPRGDATPGLIG